MTFNTEVLIEKCEELAQNQFKTLDKIALHNQKKVLDAFRKNKISAMHFQHTNGYGYDDIGRDTLNTLFSDIFGGEASIVSPLIANGTHTITLALFGLLRPYDKLVSITGKPYDTMVEVIEGTNIGSLKDYLVDYQQIDMKNDDFDYENIKIALLEKPKLVFIQRSKGYLWRNSLSIDRIGKIIKFVKDISPNTLVLVDNCYGEFVEKIEPTSVGADVIVGSMIKNPGGGLAPTGGYICGKKELIEQISYRLTAPSLGLEVGSYYASYQPFYQGLFLAPTTVRNALKGNVLTSYLFKELGYDTCPSAGNNPTDIIVSIKLNTAEELVSFCQNVQKASPIDSFALPEPWDMPGYADQVVMAAGTFVQGASLELTADGTIKDPYIVYMQGGVTYEHTKIALAEIINNL